MKNGDFTHFEIPADDPGRAKAFYEGAFGWSFAPDIPGFEGYHLFTTPVGQEGMGGAIGKRGENAPDALRTYIQVDSIDDAMARIADLGGTVVQPRDEVPGQGWYGVFRDPEGNELALWESLPGE
jgi:uncharacterized protein